MTFRNMPPGMLGLLASEDDDGSDAQIRTLTRTVEEQRATIERLEASVRQLKGDRCPVCDEDGLIYVAVQYTHDGDGIDERAETCPCCNGTRSGYASAVTKERDGLAADLAETRACLATAREELVKAWQEKDAAVREADRLRHDVPIEGDFVCPDSLRADEARRELAEARQVIADYTTTIHELQAEKREAGEPLAWAVCDSTGNIPDDDDGWCDMLVTHDLLEAERIAAELRADLRDHRLDPAACDPGTPPPTEAECNAAVTVIPLYPRTPAEARRGLTEEERAATVMWAYCEEPTRDGAPAPCGWNGPMSALRWDINGISRCPRCNSCAIREDADAPAVARCPCGAAHPACDDGKRCPYCHKGTMRVAASAPSHQTSGTGEGLTVGGDTPRWWCRLSQGNAYRREALAIGDAYRGKAIDLDDGTGWWHVADVGEPVAPCTLVDAGQP